MKRFLQMMLMLVMPAVAQVSWTPSGGVPSSPIFSSPEGLKVCRVVSGGNTYGGQERGGQCYYVVSGAVASSNTYEVAIGLGKWDVPGLTGPATLGNIAAAPTRSCRARFGSEWVSGYTESAGSICRVARVSGASSATRFELLYDFSYSGEFHVSHNGLCVTARVGQQPPVRLEACSELTADQWRLVAATGGYRVESVLFAGQCLNGQNLAACGSAPVFAMETWSDRLVQFRQASGLQVLQRASAGKTTGATLALASGADGFEVLTLTEASRRLSVLTYNVMMLPDDQFPRLKQDERAGWIPTSLNRQGALADVIGFQEGFQTSARTLLTLGLLATDRYLWFTGVPDWPDSIYDSEWLNPLTYLTFGQFRVFTNGGAFLTSRWPIEKTGYLRFTAASQDGPLDSTGFDAFAAKGVAYARIQKLGRRYHVFTTHLQAGPPDDEAAVRQAQFQQMRTFATLMMLGASPDDGVVFTGDFNTDMELDAANYYYMIDTLQANFVDAPRPIGTSTSASSPRWTVDPDTNRLTQERESTHQWLDYVLVGRQNAQPDLASYEVFQFKHTSTYGINVGVLAASDNLTQGDLSDHGGVLARFRFAPAASTVLPSETVALTLRSFYLGTSIAGATVSVNGGTVPTPSTVDVLRNEPVEVIAPKFVAGGAGTRYRFLEWSRGSAQSFTITPTAASEERAYYAREYEVKGVVSPAGAGTIAGTGYFDENASTDVQATPGPGFAFVNFITDRTETMNPARVRVRAPITVTANFVATGAPRLSLLTDGARVDTPNGMRRVLFRLVNSGVGGAVNARATLVSATTLAGSGTVTLPGGQVANFGALAAGQTSAAVAPLDFVWPAMATRVRLVLQIVADGGYATTVTLTLIR